MYSTWLCVMLEGCRVATPVARRPNGWENMPSRGELWIEENSCFHCGR
jgi:hypothetical protein